MTFKTNARCSGCVDKIISAVKQKFPDAELKLDLQSADKVLHVHGIPEDTENVASIESAIKEAGFTGAWITRGLENK